MIATPRAPELLRLLGAFDEARQAMLEAWRALASADGSHTLALAVEVENTAKAMLAMMPKRAA